MALLPFEPPRKGPRLKFRRWASETLSPALYDRHMILSGTAPLKSEVEPCTTTENASTFEIQTFKDFSRLYLILLYRLHLTLLYKPSKLAKRMTSLWWGLKIKSLPGGNSDSTNSLNLWRKIFYYQTSWKNVIQVMQNGLDVVTALAACLDFWPVFPESLWLMSSTCQVARLWITYIYSHHI